MLSDGSSPRLRGTGTSGERRELLQRFIPAPAGNSPGRQALDGIHPVHPRACGEQVDVWRRGVLSPGSSPRLRGTAACPRTGWVWVRFIPAPAGNSLPTRTPSWGRPVHPRACGEQNRRTITASSTFGSSPRLRGTGGLGELNQRVHRFIPAPAGNSVNATHDNQVFAVHPRACGEQRSSCFPKNMPCGSSPRLRGTGAWVASSEIGQRFIPAPAGNRARDRANSAHSTVHPRACGEQWA